MVWFKARANFHYSKNNAIFISGQNRLKNIHLAFVVLIRDTLCIFKRSRWTLNLLFLHVLLGFVIAQTGIRKDVSEYLV